MTTSVDDPSFLRAVALDQYDPEAGWTMSNLAGETSIADDDELYPPPAGQSTRSVSAQIEVIEHNDRFLPVPVFPAVGADERRRATRTGGSTRPPARSTAAR